MTMRKFNVPLDLSAAGVQMASGGLHRRAVAHVHYSSILDYACADVATKPFLDDLRRPHAMRSTEHELDTRGGCDNAALVRNREQWYGPTRVIDVSDDRTTGRKEKYCEVGDVIQVHLGISDVNRVSCTIWGGEQKADNSIFGRVFTIFDVRHWDDDSNASSRNQEEALWRSGIGALWYEWKGKTAARSKTPLLQPGDCVAILHPLFADNCTERVLVVNRFVRGVNERAKFVFLTSVNRDREFLGPQTIGKHTCALAEKIALPLRQKTKLSLGVRSLTLVR